MTLTVIVVGQGFREVHVLTFSDCKCLFWRNLWVHVIEHVHSKATCRGHSCRTAVEIGKSSTAMCTCYATVVRPIIMKASIVLMLNLLASMVISISASLLLAVILNFVKCIK